MKYYSIKDTCKETGLSQYYIRELCKKNSVPYIRCGLKIMISIDDLNMYLDSIKCPPVAERINNVEVYH